MYKILEKNLEDKKRFYQIIELSLDITLSGAEKSALVRYLSRTNHTCWNDLWKDTKDYLWNLGFKSKKFEEIRERERKVEKYWGNLFYNR